MMALRRHRISISRYQHFILSLYVSQLILWRHTFFLEIYYDYFYRRSSCLLTNGGGQNEISHKWPRKWRNEAIIGNERACRFDVWCRASCSPRIFHHDIDAARKCGNGSIASPFYDIWLKLLADFIKSSYHRQYLLFLHDSPDILAW